MSQYFPAAVPRFLFCLLVFILAFCQGSSRAGAESSRGPAAPVVVAPVEERVVALTLELVGTAVASRTSRVAAEVAGLVKTINFKKGGLVTSGAALVTLDKTSQRLALKASQAVLAGTNIRLDKARQDLERSASLKKAQTISVQNYERDIFTVRTLEQEVARAQTEVTRLTDRINRMVVRAPFTGSIIEQHTEVGQWLHAGAPVVTLMDLSFIKVRVLLPERYLDEIKVGSLARVTFDAFKGDVFKGQVSVIIPAAAEKSRNLP
ncbi:MAG: efflux RND transporter periplasmic adaptor subunit, partial [Deltaproteobacteria bacterium]|nr:efflux RND transporter periplasmic adaptor subunit [Deltaproteobacteria bacterium]